ncbi:MAG TPA: NAD-dependent epimerase/dehydratase family protein [Bacteroidia bacterium]|nr:MAG: NAD-dependent epimerase/dehydratase [Bacteroidetes bacterium OLB10]MBV6453829.1 GDP-L-fucose synthase [Bacteroidia bacterium]MBX3106434.1 NAD-dependent epimerase/dehydratase family protein [Bacteroidota bacterium]OQB60775.1 MAG: 3 beta-hydroxysteroid dehydrogenase/Delta 5-->4-isomerase [Bacteroidetes bacterium ADurb.Bin141]MCB8931634.1 NAD-dependent epimerase/dehydratase family protein [Bacteroidia bacterium]
MHLVTGATGLLGSQLTLDLMRQGKKVRVLVRKNSKRDLLKHKFRKEEKLYETLQFAEGDLLDYFSLEDALDGITHVYHCAALVNFAPGKRKDLFKTNAEGTENLVNACLEKSDVRLAYVSSVATLGRGISDQETDESTLWDSSQRNSAYAESKYAAEREVWRGITEGLNAVIINPSVILGEGNWRNDSSSLIRKVYEGMPFFTKGVSGFVDAKDVSRSLIALMESDIRSERFIVSAENKSYEWLLKTIARNLNVRPPRFHATPLLSGLAWRMEKLRSLFSGKPTLITRETTYSAQQKYLYSHQKISQALNFSFTPLERTLEEICALYLQQRT